MIVENILQPNTLFYLSNPLKFSKPNNLTTKTMSQVKNVKRMRKVKGQQKRRKQQREIELSAAATHQPARKKMRSAEGERLQKLREKAMYKNLASGETRQAVRNKNNIPIEERKLTKKQRSGAVKGENVSTKKQERLKKRKEAALLRRARRGERTKKRVLEMNKMTEQREKREKQIAEEQRIKELAKLSKKQRKKKLHEEKLLKYEIYKAEQALKKHQLSESLLSFIADAMWDKFVASAPQVTPKAAVIEPIAPKVVVVQPIAPKVVVVQPVAPKAPVVVPSLYTEPIKKNKIIKKRKKQQRVSQRKEVHMVFAIPMKLKMGKGKIAAQVGHATIGLYKQLLERKNENLMKVWEQNGSKKVVLKIPKTSSIGDILHKSRNMGFIQHIVTDAGRTQIAAGSQTVIAFVGPSNALKHLTNTLSLM